ncbi:MAG TPA: hypothetical protein ENK02_07745 [Planctomycetes bacterium]|nr:hypothetical protein [Planctomycetota bacterium]
MPRRRNHSPFPPSLPFLFVLLSLLGTSLEAQKVPGDLPEVGRLEGLQEVLSNQWVLHPKGRSDYFFAWVEEHILKGKLEGETVFLVRSRGGMARVDKGSFLHLREQALFDKSLDFIKGRLWEEGATTKTIDFWWEKGKVWRHQVHGRKKAKPLPSPGRPVLLSMLFKLPYRIPKNRKSHFAVLDTQEGKVENLELEPIQGSFRFGKTQVSKYHSSQMGGMDLFIHPGSGKLLHAVLTKLPLEITWTEMPPEDRDKGLLFNPILQKKARELARKAWKKVGIRWKNKLLGVEIPLPKKNWERVTPTKDSVIFQYRPRDQTMDCFLDYERIPRTLSLDSYLESIVQVYRKRMVPEGTYELQDVKLARRKGKKLSFRYKVKDDSYPCEIIIIPSGPHLLRFSTYYWDDSTIFKKDLEWIRKRLILRKRR